MAAGDRAVAAYPGEGSSRSVDPSATLKLDGELLARYPEDYRHLAYSLVRAGQKVRTDVPGLGGPALDTVYARGAAWLAGKLL